MTSKKLSITFALIILATGLYFLLIPNHNIDVLPLITVNEDSPLKEYVSINDHLIVLEKSQGEADDSQLFEGENQYVLSASIDNLPFGVYMLKTHYFTNYDTPGYNTPSVRLYFNGGRPNAYEVEITNLMNHQSFHKTPIYVSGLKGTTWVAKDKSNRNLQLQIEMLSDGVTHIDSLTIEEYTPWKFGVILLELFIYCLLLLAIKFNIFSDSHKRLKFLAIVLLITFTSIPAISSHYSNYEGHDYLIHITRIAQIASELASRNFPALYQPDCAYGYGYILNIMYGSLFLFLPAILHVLGMPLAYAYNCYIIAINITTVLICLYSFKKIFKSEKYGYIATALYTLSTYRICDIYVRTALGEYTAMAFLPLLAYGVYKIYTIEKPKYGDYLPLIIGASAIIECHILSTEMTCIFVGIFALMNFKKTIKLIPGIALAGLSILLINIGFIIPFLQLYTSGLQINSSIYSNGLYLTSATIGQIFNLFMTATGLENGFTTNNELPMTIGLSLIIGLVMYLIILICKKDISYSESEEFSRKLSINCFVLAILALWLSSNLFPWEFFEKNTDIFSKTFTSIQFTWRYIEFATLFLATLTTYAIKIFTDKKLLEKVFHTQFNLTLILLFSSVLVMGLFFKDYLQETNIIYIPSKTSDFVIDALYYPEGIVLGKMYDNHPVVLSGDATIYSLGASEKGERTFSVTSNSDALVALPVVKYNFLTIEDLATSENLTNNSEDNNFLIASIPAGYNGQIIVKHHFPTLWKIGYAVSVLSSVLLLFYISILRKRRTS